MGAFSDLLVEAKGLGAKHLVLTVNLNEYTGAIDVLRWSCESYEDGMHHRGCGRSGEEAVCEMITHLRTYKGLAK